MSRDCITIDLYESKVVYGDCYDIASGFYRVSFSMTKGYNFGLDRYGGKKEHITPYRESVL